MNPIVLEARNLTKHFGGVTALASVDLALHENEILGLIGPNGAGKTTFINVVTGLDRPSGGEVIYCGVSIAGKPSYHAARMGLARTFQVVKPFRNLTALENVAVGAMFGAGGARRRTRQAFEHAEEVLMHVGMKEKMKSPASSLTIPDLKRVELAKALAMDPFVLLLDEVMAGLHSREIAQAVELLQQVHASGVTLLVVEHVMKAIMALSQRIVVLDFGTKIAEGTPAEIVENPKVIAAYLGDRYVARTKAERRGAPAGDQ